MPGRWPSAAAAAILLLFLPRPPAAAADDAPTVAPGTVVRWPGEALESCTQEGRAFAPLAGACWYPVDLLTAEGAVLRLARRSRRGVEERRVRVAAYPYPVQVIEIADDSRVNLSARDLARTERERARVAAVFRREGPRHFDLPLAAPLDPLPPASGFGARRVFNRQPRSPHTGADFSARRGTPVLAAADGRVALAEEHFFAGRSVYLDHGDGLVTMYFHLEAIEVEAGEEVRRGQAIGRVGSSGRSAGPHLHFGVRWRGARVDPAVLLSPELAQAP